MNNIVNKCKGEHELFCKFVNSKIEDNTFRWKVKNGMDYKDEYMHCVVKDIFKCVR